MISQGNGLVNYSGFWEKHHFSPIAVNFITLASLFFLYQIFGGFLSLLIGGITITDQSVAIHRFLQSLFQFLFLGIPTLLFVGLHTNQRFPFAKENLIFLGLDTKVNPKLFLYGAIGALALNPVLSYIADLQEVILSDVFGLKNEVLSWKSLFEGIIEKLASAKTFGEFLIVVMVVALTPAICEELVFRGYIQRNFSRVLSPIKTIIYTGTIFGLYHLNPLQTLSLIFIGIYISYLRWSSGSLWLCIVAHFVFNFFSVFGLYMLNNAKIWGIEESLITALKENEPNILSPFSIVSTIIAFGFFCFILNKYREELRKSSYSTESGSENSKF